MRDTRDEIEGRLIGPTRIISVINTSWQCFDEYIPSINACDIPVQKSCNHRGGDCTIVEGTHSGRMQLSKDFHQGVCGIS